MYLSIDFTPTLYTFGVDTMETTSKTRWVRFTKIASVALLSLSGFVLLARQGYSVDGSFQARTAWDWMQLFLIPLILACAALLVNRSGRNLERERAETRSALAHELESDRQQEEALQAYLDRMIELVMKDKLSRFSPDEVRNVARTRTLTVLRLLNSRRKGLVVLFLRDSHLIDREAVVDLCGADLTGAFLPTASLKHLNLGEADLSKADLRGADLSKSYLSGTKLTGAHLNGANLAGADLFDADLNSADLSRVNLNKANLNGADLRGCRLNEGDLREADLSGVNLNVGDLVRADLRGANLGGAKLVGADLSQADLSGTEITRTELDKAKSLAGTTLPDGSKHN